ncbi:hypothetical protein A9Q84_17505 [Halobacteriovorax marinus]|uniref:glucan 1,4-alpha-glucosidase n=1 Tax=Halobacteriovorax marinus TaxID=97084 RepID=A0A1Y5F8J0_9BACT|nr:hypothetical protein A9Q84_17505 [Halobacteriovorax marinus]
MKAKLILSFVLLVSMLNQSHGKMNYLVDKLMDNISPSDAVRGIVVASPSKEEPNYYYHWVRDAALVMDVVNSLYNRELDPIRKQFYKEAMMDYTYLVKSNQETFTYSDLGEPKFYVNGDAYLEPWGRPQNDGPALRAITLIKFANSLLDQGEYDLVKNLFYNGSIPATSVIKRDLEFVSHHYQEISFDYWEEVIGYHFSTEMVQRRALIEGAKLARRLDDNAAADWYVSQAKKIETMIHAHWDESKNIIRASRHINNKPSGLDVATILGVLHAKGDDNFYSFSDERVLSTAIYIKDSFKAIYKINQDSKFGTAIGRYPEDTYDGYTTASRGNPWFLATVAYAELYTHIKKDFLRKNVINITAVSAPFFRDIIGETFLPMSENISLTSSLGKRILSGLDRKIEGFYKRVEHHRSRSGNISEQMHRDYGRMQGARDLTWSYASYISALLAK